MKYNSHNTVFSTIIIICTFFYIKYNINNLSYFISLTSIFYVINLITQLKKNRCAVYVNLHKLTIILILFIINVSMYLFS